MSPDAKIEVGENEHATLADLTFGVQVEAKVNPLTGELTKLDVDHMPHPRPDPTLNRRARQ
ncbi:MAG: hypothetical protein VW450_04115 [Chloroflexota bacterium]